jgi:hypothetical protein
MRMEDLGSYLLDDVLDSPTKVADNLELTQPRQSGGQPVRHRGAQEFPLADAPLKSFVRAGIGVSLITSRSFR